MSRASPHKKSSCIKGESNPRRVDGNDPGYHYPINARHSTRIWLLCSTRPCSCPRSLVLTPFRMRHCPEKVFRNLTRFGFTNNLRILGIPDHENPEQCSKTAQEPPQLLNKNPTNPYGDLMRHERMKLQDIWIRKSSRNIVNSQTFDATHDQDAAN